MCSLKIQWALVSILPAMMTVIAENYPGSKIVKPIGYPLLAILSFEMVYNGVH